MFKILRCVIGNRIMTRSNVTTIGRLIIEDPFMKGYSSQWYLFSLLEVTSIGLFMLL
jgi:hypothetical protein